MSDFSHSNMFGGTPPLLTGNNLNTDKSTDCCPTVDDTYIQGTDLVVVFSNGETATYPLPSGTITWLGGTTAARPTGVARVLWMMYFDTTLGFPVWWNGTNWVNSSGAIV